MFEATSVVSDEESIRSSDQEERKVLHRPQLQMLSCYRRSHLHGQQRGSREATCSFRYALYALRKGNLLAGEIQGSLKPRISLRHELSSTQA